MDVDGGVRRAHGEDKKAADKGKKVLGRAWADHESASSAYFSIIHGRLNRAIFRLAEKLTV